jgi:DNA-binding transcriptional ArsR family regulator
MQELEKERVDERSLELKAGIFKVLGDPNRIRILEMLRGGEMCQCEIAPKIDRSQPTVSRYLSMLEETGLIRSRKEGVKVFYEVTDPEIFCMLDCMEDGLLDSITEELMKRLAI